MHILHITPYYAPAYAYGGVVRAVEGMARALVARGHTVTVLTTDTLNQHGGRIALRDEIRDGVRVVRVPNLSPWLRGRYNLSTPEYLKRVTKPLLPGVDVVHLHEFRTVENILATPLVQKAGIPMMLSPHGTLATHTGRSTLKHRWDSWFSPQIAYRIDHVIALTPAEQADAQALWTTFWKRQTPTQFSIIPNGVNIADFATLPNADSYRQKWGLGDQRVVLFLGRLHPRKGADVLLEAFKQANLPNTTLLIAGPDDGLGEKLRQMRDERVVMTDYLDGEARLGAFAVADVFVLPAVGEGLSIASLEALACGVPVIISPECYLPVVAEVDAGIIVEPQVDPLAHALTAFFSDDNHRQHMRLHAKALIAEHFTWEKVGAQLEVVYHGSMSS